MLRNHGRDGSGYVSNWGYNGRLDNLQAAFLRISCEHTRNQLNVDVPLPKYIVIS